MAFFKNRQIQTVIGSFLILFSLFLFVAFISFFFHWQQDLSIINEFTNSNAKGENLLGKVGAILSNLFIYKGVGIGAFIIPYLLFISGLFWMFRTKLSKVISSYNWGLLSMLWISVTFGFFETSSNILSGTIGYEVNEYLQLFIGKTGLGIILFFLLTAYITIRFKITPEVILNRIKSKKPEISNDNHENVIPQTTNEETTEENEVKSEFELSLENLKPTIQNHSNVKKTTDISPIETYEPTLSISKKVDKTVDIDVTEITEEENVTENLSKKLVEDFGEFDPTLELANYKFPTLNLLKQYNESISVYPEELEQNKNKIVDTLKNYKIGIAQIKATVGPTITLYEIVPEAGIRISKIKNLEDDIALSLSALGIRIIAPIPGKGTIGIEVPNKKSTIVSMHSVIASKRFQESKMELPIALGKTISNETFVVDLAKMPHLLMAGATGQGKSVGLNAVLTSLLYRKHPAEVKFVLVDPKKVELTLFNKIERHYLAKLPDTDEAIITDTTKVVNTLNSLCIEMDNRYDLLKSAMVRNIKEYNTKFKARKLNPN